MGSKLLNLLLLLSISVLLFSACGKSETQNPKLKTQNSSDTQVTPNLVINGDFEQGTTTPEGWTTQNQFLNNITGWSSDERHSGNHSLEIQNIGYTNASWNGKAIEIKDSYNCFDASIWTKASGMKGNGKFQLELLIYAENKNDNSQKNSTETITLPITDHGWGSTEFTIGYPSIYKIVKIVPSIKFDSMTGTVWIDDFKISPVINFNESNSKILYSSNVSGNKFSEQAKKISEDNGVSIFDVTGKATIYSSEFIPVEASKLYKLSGDFLSGMNEENNVYIGLCSFDEDKKEIMPINVFFRADTETELIRPCNPDDKELFVKNAEKWVGNAPWACVAFNIDSSGNLKDLPNRSLSKMGINGIEKENNYWKIILSEPCGNKYSRGTKIREHVIIGAADTYLLEGTPIFSDKWTQYSGFIASRDSKYIIFPNLRPGTRYVKIIMLINYQKGQETQFKNILFEELD